MHDLSRVGRVAMGAALVTIAACSARGSQAKDSTMTHRSIEDVRAEHTDSLMRIPGVVGTMIGLCDSTPCIKVLAARATGELHAAIPDSLDGYRVMIDETGTIRAQDSSRR